MDSCGAPAVISRRSQKEFGGCESDDAAPAIPLQVRDHFARKIYAAEKVQFEGALPLLEVAARNPLAGGPPALVTQISMPPNFCATAATKWLTAAASVRSKGIGNNVHVMLLSDLLRRALQNLLVARAHGDAATLPGERFRRGTTNPLTRGCDQRDPIFQSKIHEGGIINGAQWKAFTCRSSCTPLIWKRRGTL